MKKSYLIIRIVEETYEVEAESAQCAGQIELIDPFSVIVKSEKVIRHRPHNKPETGG